MNIKKFVFKFINHNDKKIHIFEFDVHSLKIHEWKQREDDIEGYVKWISNHARWEKYLKKEIKKMVVNKFTITGFSLRDYVLECEKSERKSKNINTTKTNSTELNFVQVFHIEKCILKYVRGINTGTSKVSHLQYKKYHEIVNLLVDDDDNNIILRETSCTNGGKIIIQQDENITAKQPNNTNAIIFNPQPNITPAQVNNNNNQFGGNYDNQMGGKDDDDYKLYKKYKKKYLDLKNSNY